MMFTLRVIARLAFSCQNSQSAFWKFPQYFERGCWILAGREFMLRENRRRLKKIKLEEDRN